MQNEKHKIVLYNPKAVFFDMPLALLAIASCLDQRKYKIVIIDGRIEKDPHQKVIKEVKDALCLGITVLTGNPIADAVSISREVKQVSPGLPIIWGGWHTSLFPEKTLVEEQSVDITVQGQGEITFKELTEAFINRSSLNNIKGICFSDSDNKIIKNPPREIADMNDLPGVDYSLINVEDYFKAKGRKQFDYISSIGCLYRCKFCADPLVFKRKYSFIDHKRMGDELERHFHEYGFSDVNFQDETFFTNRNRIVGFANELIKRNVEISWTATLRADQGARISQDEFHLLAKSGLRRLLVGVESGSQKILDWLKKDISKEQVIQTAHKCINSNISVQFPFIVGFPDESEDEFLSTVDFALELSKMSDLFKIIFFYYRPYPGSALSDELLNNGFKFPSTLSEWSGFDYISSSGSWVSKQKYKYIERIKFYLLLSLSDYKLIYPLKQLAKFRIRLKRFGFPFEKLIYSLIKPFRN